ncbi:putative sporulation protein YyaC [Clostridium collagenovorans DSM 3089]|uniref:Putative sporulation protein YyaC n=1 Tax=Clostridium collagenovorans DSM 3089 TaxID=1121306 RepID=A0A1M5W1V6_9CLOT|nr:spore protease YyaC [Clostridium collagenovorans]SHH81496.1 putative sporulation protein YyaC [Clostridium collagenovorans DSM 3089]
MNSVKVYYEDPLAYYKLAFHLKNFIKEDTIIICIGTDKCIGDCLGPLVGTYLKEKNFPLPVFGTIDEPIHALNLKTKVPELLKLYPNSTVIGIDACLGSESNIGDLQLRNVPVTPGKGVGKTLPKVGDLSIVGIVDSSDMAEMFFHTNIRLNLIMNMANVISDSLIHAYYLHSTDK